MKKTVWWVVVSLAMAGASLVMGRGTAWAQQGGAKSIVLCGGVPTEVPFTPEDWKGFSGEQQQTACMNAGLQQKRSGEEHGRKLAIAGLVVTLAGTALILPQGHEDHILGDTYCVQETTYTVDVNYGGCTSVAPKYGVILLAAGVTMMSIGFHQMSVSPEITPTSKAIKATIKWGGSHAKR